MQTIYELKAEYQAMEASLNEMVEAGEIDEQCLNDTLAGIEGDLQDKCIQLCKSIKNREAQVVGFKQRHDEIKSRSKTLGNRIKNMEQSADYLKQAVSEILKTLGEKEINTPDFRIRHVGQRGVVEVLDFDKVDEKFVEVKTTYSVRKTKAYEYLARGEELSGLQLVSKKRLEIK